jgi:hypothetical protein
LTPITDATGLRGHSQRQYDRNAARRRAIDVYGAPIAPARLTNGR